MRKQGSRAGSSPRAEPRRLRVRSVAQPKAYVQPVVNCVHVLGKRQYIAATGPGIAAGAGGGYTLSVNGQVGSVWPQVRTTASMGTVRAPNKAAGLPEALLCQEDSDAAPVRSR